MLCFGQDLMNLDEGDIKKLGVTNGAHRAAIASSLVLLRNKYQPKSSF